MGIFGNKLRDLVDRISVLMTPIPMYLLSIYLGTTNHH